MSDFKDMLGIDRDQAQARQASKPKAYKPRKVEAKNREVYSLTGGQLPPIQVTKPAAPAFKAKRLALSQNDFWEWQPFIHPGRTDGMVFRHWAKKRTNDSMVADYPFAKFAKKIKMFRYTEEEYEKHLQDKDWTKDETDRLFELCERFDLRFVIIADRFEPQKSVEELKERFYYCSKKIMELHTPIEEIPKHPLSKFPFDKQFEVERKQQYEKLMTRGKSEMEEEEYLLTELKRIEQSCKKHSQDRKNILQLSRLASENSTYHELIGQEEQAIVESNKKRNIIMPKKKEKTGPGATLRSAKQLLPLPVSAKVSQKLDCAFDELGLGSRTSFTSKVSAEFDNLRQDLLILIDLQKHVTKREYELQILRERIKGLESAKGFYTEQETAVDTEERPTEVDAPTAHVLPDATEEAGAQRLVGNNDEDDKQ